MARQNVIDSLKERGLLKQVVYEEELKKLLDSGSQSFYIGFDPTADSLHVGHFMQMIVAKRLQDAGHRPIILIGGGTAMVGDPSGRTDMRSMMTRETINHNVECFKKQMQRFVRFEGENAAILVNNADWLLDLNYVDFLRDVGASFSVNRMLTAECYKQRLEKGLTFLEFNYMLMQAYDFLVLNRKYGCVLQCGGDDQWSNMLAGADLIRRKEQKEAYAVTFALLTTSEGIKMGKTSKGAVWLDAEKTSPYDFFQYWRNIADEDVEKVFRYLTFLPLDEIEELTKYRDERINKAKERLAYELTLMVHGEDAANEALKKARGAFSGDSENMPSATIPAGMTQIADILVAVAKVPSKGEAKRLIAGGGISVDNVKVTDIFASVTDSQLASGFVLQKGKKNFYKVSVK
ncbi:MAG: tyrosine--tRNA ligase [Bacteroides sp.]|nr:tyrosine--tRNA ligase [Bacillota bacterium]MCM1394302.1 tyrosine--tRNA ligase [[Eubacterium] siraeum]MCM1455614.1 tyrosine--tRNA ligase [Bacteroides sp.]